MYFDLILSWFCEPGEVRNHDVYVDLRNYVIFDAFLSHQDFQNTAQNDTSKLTSIYDAFWVPKPRFNHASFLDLKNGAGIEAPYQLELGSIGQTITAKDQEGAFRALNEALDVHLAERAKQVLAILLPHERAGFRRYVEGVLEVMFWTNEMSKPAEPDDDDTSELNTITAEAEPLSRLETAIRQLILVRQRKV